MPGAAASFAPEVKRGIDVYSLDIDIGGTFTDGFFTDGTDVRTAKVLTTPHDVTEGFIDCIRRGSELFGLDTSEFLRRTHVARMSTTIGTNLLVQRKGARIGVLVTAGEEEGLYALDKPKALGRIVGPGMIVGIEEKVSDGGDVMQAPDREAVLAAVRALIHKGAQLIVVSFRNSWRNADNEIAVRTAIRERYPVHYLRSVIVQLGSELVHDRDDHARTNSALLNAYIHAEMARVLFRAEDKLRHAGYERPLLIVHASGGNARIAKTIALNTLHSGPAVAVKGAAVLAEALDLDHVVSADMGGTSFDIGLVTNRRADRELTPQVEEMRIATPVIRVDSVAIGGGTIAWVDEANVLQLGPESAGSAPGPACYGKGGTEPTVTDANLVLGCLDPDYFLGGRMKLDTAAARRAIERRVARKLGISVEQAAFDIRKLADRKMADAILQRIVEAGIAPGKVDLFSVGGAGPLHVCDIAAATGLRSAYAFPFGSVFSAFGGSNTDVQHLYRHTFVTAPTRQDLIDAINAIADQARRDMRAEGFAEEAVTCHVAAHVPGDHLAASAPLAEVETVASALHLSARGRPLLSIEIAAEAKLPHWGLTSKPLGNDSPEPKGTRSIFWDRDAAVETAVFDREQLRPGACIVGPAIVEGDDTTYAVIRDWSLRIHPTGCFVFSRAG